MQILKPKEGPTNQDLAEMNNLRDTAGKLKNNPEQALYDAQGGFYRIGKQQEIPKAYNQQAFDRLRSKNRQNSKFCNAANLGAEV